MVLSFCISCEKPVKILIRSAGYCCCFFIVLVITSQRFSASGNEPKIFRWTKLHHLNKTKRKLCTFHGVIGGYQCVCATFGIRLNLKHTDNLCSLAREQSGSEHGPLTVTRTTWPTKPILRSTAAIMYHLNLPPPSRPLFRVGRVWKWPPRHTHTLKWIHTTTLRLITDGWLDL